MKPFVVCLTFTLASAMCVMASGADATTLDNLPARLCQKAGAQGRMIDNRYIIDQLLVDGNVHLTSAVYDPPPFAPGEAFALNRLGDRVMATARYCRDPRTANSDYCSIDEIRRIASLQDAAALLLSQAAMGTVEKAYRVTLVPGHTTDADVQAFLNGDNAWYQVACAEAPVLAAQEAPKQNTWRIAGRYTDLGGGDYSKASFATLAVVNDRAGSDHTVTAKLAIGYLLSSAKDPNITGIGYASYDKSTSRSGGEVENDVALGYYYQNNANNFGLDISAHTDDRGRSQLYRLAASQIWQVGHGGFALCRPAGAINLYCSLALAGDYVGVGHNGDRDALKDIKSYTRVGGDGDYAAIVPLFADASLSLSARYQKRLDFQGKADAEFQEYTVGFMPDKRGHINLSLTYSYGKALIDLVPTKKTMITLGYQR